jgi:endogenous inhibitor of DNA gyrase (YacG/DUF329 family)
VSDHIDLGAWFAEHYPESERTGHRLFAKAMGFFWLPCPLCGTESGGHEWRDIDGKPSAIPGNEPNTAIGICPSCTRAGKGIRP